MAAARSTGSKKKESEINIKEMAEKGRASARRSAEGARKMAAKRGTVGKNKGEIVGKAKDEGKGKAKSGGRKLKFSGSDDNKSTQKRTTSFMKRKRKSASEKIKPRSRRTAKK